MADSPSGAVGEVTLRNDGDVLLAAEITERIVDHGRLVATFNPPNTQVPYTFNGTTYDVDFTSMREGEGSSPTAITYAVVTSRSYHAGIVQSLLMDGSVRTVGNNISGTVWRSLGTRRGSEVIGEF